MSDRHALERSPLGLGDTQRYRLRAILREFTDPTELAIRLGERDRDYLIRPPLRRRAHPRGNSSSLGAAGSASLQERHRRRRLRSRGHAAELVRRYRLTPDPAGTIVLRSTRMDIGFVRHLAGFGRTLAAVDAATSLDPRDRGVGERYLLSRLKLFRANDRL